MIGSKFVLRYSAHCVIHFNLEKRFFKYVIRIYTRKASIIPYKRHTYRFESDKCTFLESTFDDGSNEGISSAYLLAVLKI